jgi:hypothetical protein
MKKLVLAAFLAVPVLAVSQQKASAQCTDLPQWLRYKFCTCVKCATGHGGAHGIGGCGPGGCGAGGYGCGAGGCYRTYGHCGCGCLPCGLCGLLGCDTKVPGPWYLYWPYDGQRLTLNGYGPAWPGGWNYEWHFQVATPWGVPPLAAPYPPPPMAPGIAEAP